jgi:hypothetical protein
MHMHAVYSMGLTLKMRNTTRKMQGMDCSITRGLVLRRGPATNMKNVALSEGIKESASSQGRVPHLVAHFTFHAAHSVPCSCCPSFCTGIGSWHHHWNLQHKSVL